MASNGESKSHSTITVIILAISLIASIGYNIFQYSQTESFNQEILRLNQEILNLTQENQRLYNESLRADLSIIVEQIANQNWTFTTEGAYFEFQATLFNDGARAAEITKAEVNLTFTSDDGKITHTSTNPVNISGFSITEYTIEKNDGRILTFSSFIEKFTWKSPDGSRELEMGVAKPTGMSLTVWYYDSIGEKVSYGEAH